MKSFQACLLVLATCASALVIPNSGSTASPIHIAKRDDACTPGLFNCLDGQHWQQCVVGGTWSVSMPVAPGMACTPGISENPFIRAGDSPASTSVNAPAPTQPTTSAVAPPPPAPATTDVAPPPVTPSTTTTSSTSSQAQPTTSDLPPPPAPTTTDVAPPPVTPSTTTSSTSSQAQPTTSDLPPPPAQPTTTTTSAAQPSITDSPPPPAQSTTLSTSSSTTSSVDTSITDSPPPPPGADRPTPTATSEAPHTSDSAPTSNPSPSAGPTVDQVCIDFTSDDPTWTYANQYPWGTNSGTFGDLNDGQLCVPTSNTAGGAMFIGSTANPGPGNTKLECYFPTSGQANCDISLVDGYSLSVTCTAGEMRVGGDINLWEQNTGSSACSDVSGGVCQNKLGYTPAQSDVGPFFQPAIENGNEYCIWVNCDQDYYFPVTQQLSCHVSGTVPK